MLRLFCFALLCFVFRLHAFVEGAALRSIVLRYAGAPIATRFVLFIWRRRFFPSKFLYRFRFLFVMESTSHVLSFRMVLFHLVPTGWIFDISLCEDLINQSTITNVLTFFLPNRGMLRRSRCVLIFLLNTIIEPTVILRFNSLDCTSS